MYLGLPLSGKWQPEGVKLFGSSGGEGGEGLEGWKKAFLQHGGIITLLLSVLSNLPIYYLPLFRMACG